MRKLLAALLFLISGSVHAAIYPPPIKTEVSSFTVPWSLTMHGEVTIINTVANPLQVVMIPSGTITINPAFTTTINGDSAPIVGSAIKTFAHLYALKSDGTAWNRLRMSAGGSLAVTQMFRNLIDATQEEVGGINFQDLNGEIKFLIGTGPYGANVSFGIPLLSANNETGTAIAWSEVTGTAFISSDGVAGFGQHVIIGNAETNPLQVTFIPSATLAFDPQLTTTVTGDNAVPTGDALQTVGWNMSYDSAASSWDRLLGEGGRPTVIPYNNTAAGLQRTWGISTNSISDAVSLLGTTHSTQVVLGFGMGHLNGANLWGRISASPFTGPDGTAGIGQHVIVGNLGTDPLTVTLTGDGVLPTGRVLPAWNMGWNGNSWSRIRTNSGGTLLIIPTAANESGAVQPLASISSTLINDAMGFNPSIYKNFPWNISIPALLVNGETGLDAVFVRPSATPFDEGTGAGKAGFAQDINQVAKQGVSSSHYSVAVNDSSISLTPNNFMRAHTLRVYNTNSADIFLGNADVTAANGFIVHTDSIVTYENVRADFKLYAIKQNANNADVRVERF